MSLGDGLFLDYDRFNLNGIAPTPFRIASLDGAVKTGYYNKYFYLQDDEWAVLSDDGNKYQLFNFRKQEIYPGSFEEITFYASGNQKTVLLENGASFRLVDLNSNRVIYQGTDSGKENVFHDNYGHVFMLNAYLYVKDMTSIYHIDGTYVGPYDFSYVYFKGDYGIATYHSGEHSLLDSELRKIELPDPKDIKTVEAVIDNYAVIEYKGGKHRFFRLE